jgi:hypothetical protein
MTFGTAEMAPIFGGGISVNVAPNVQIVGEIGRMNNVLPNELQDQLDEMVEFLESLTRVPITIDVEVPAFYATGGARFLIPTVGRARPYVEAQGGVARITLDLEATAAGIDISDEVLEEVGDDSETKFMLSLAGGIAIQMVETVDLELGYRYGRIFTDDPALNVNAVFAGVAFRF